MKRNFLNFLDSVEKDINGFIETEDEIVIEESIEEEPEEEIIVEKKIISKKPNIKYKLISELTKFGLNESAIQEIVGNVFSGSEESVYVKRKNVSSFKENVNKLNEKCKVDKKPEKTNQTDYASYILEGVENMEVEIEIGSLEPKEVKISELNMNNTTDHASALLM